MGGRLGCAAVIREATRNDAGVIVALWEQMMQCHRAMDPRLTMAVDASAAYSRHLTRQIRSRQACVYVADLGGLVVGYVTGEMAYKPPVYPVGRFGFISELFVVERWRRQRIGAALVEHAMRWFSAHGVTAVELLASEFNAAAVSFWSSMGFSPYLRMLRYDFPQGRRYRA